MMLLEALVWRGYVGPAKIEDAGLAAVVQSGAGTVTLAFSTDNEHVRRALGLEGEICCDGMFLAIRRPEDVEPEVALLLVELKGRNVAHAIDQLLTTINAVRTRLALDTDAHRRERTRLGAIVVSDRAMLRPVDPGLRRAFSRLGVTFEILAAQRDGKSADLTALLWRRHQRFADG